eukprot:6175847-Pleurochrysis_carterae.AAC.1
MAMCAILTRRTVFSITRLSSPSVFLSVISRRSALPSPASAAGKNLTTRRPSRLPVYGTCIERVVVADEHVYLVGKFLPRAVVRQSLVRQELHLAFVLVRVVRIVQVQELVLSSDHLWTPSYIDGYIVSAHACLAACAI